MKYRILLLIIICSATAFASGENDSLLPELSQSSGEQRIAVLNTLSRNYSILAKQDSAVVFSVQALRESEKLGWEPGIAESYISLCFYSYYYDDAKLAAYTNKLLALSKKAAYRKGIAYSYIYLSDLIADTSTVEAVYYLVQAQQLFEQQGCYLEAAIALARTADIFIGNSDYSTALKYCIEALNLYDRQLSAATPMYNIYHYAMLCNSLGIVYKNLREYDNSVKYYTKYMELSRAIGEQWGVAIAYNNLGAIERNRYNYAKALEYYNSSLKIWNSLKIDKYFGDLYLNIGNVYLESNSYSLAEAYYDSSFKYFQLMDSPVELSKVTTCQASLYLCQKDFKKAKGKYLESLALNSKDGNLQVIVEIYKGLATTYDSLRDYRNSYFYYKLYTEKKDSLYSLEKATEVGQVTANYETLRKIEEREKLEKQAAEQERAAVNRRNTLQYSGITIFVIAFFTFIFLSGKFRISDTVLEVMVFVSLLLLFEFIQIFLDPYINELTNSEPFYMLLANIAIVAAIIPIDAYLERFLNKRVINKQLPGKSNSK